MTNGKPITTQLTPEQAAVACAIQRLVQACNIEIAQLHDVWNMRDASVPLIRMMKDLDAYAKKFVAETQRRVIIPDIAVPSIAKG